jgi:hypothetical protein
MRFAIFPTINWVIPNASDVRIQSHHVVGGRMENRPTMTRRDGASEFPNLNEWFEQTQGGQTSTPQARGPAVAELKKDLQLNSNDAA